MEVEQDADARRHQLGRFGYPPENPEDVVPMSSEMRTGLAAFNAHIEAQRLSKQAEMDTPEGRKEAAKVAAAELAEKRRRWGTRVGATPLDGFVGIYDSAEDKEIKVYTRTYDLKHKFWGIKPVGMTIWDFWDIHDPEVKRYHDANQETPASSETLAVAPAPMHSSQCTKSTAKSTRRQRSPNINPTRRVRKSTTPPSKVSKNTRKSLAHKIDSGKSELEAQVREVEGAVRASGRPARNKADVMASGPEQKSAKAKSAAQDNTLSQLKRPRGRPPTKGKSTHRPSNQKKAPLVKGNARVTKSSQKESRPSAPSTHKMRTRRAGPAEPLQLP